MFIVDIIPLTRLPRHLPQTLSYFSSKEIRKGVLTMVKIRNKETPAIVISCEDARARRIEIKRKGFEMKPIDKIVSDTPILTDSQIRLGFWLAKYYIEPLTYIFRSITPKLPKKITKEFIADLKDIPDTSAARSAQMPRPLLLYSGDMKTSMNYIRAEMEKFLAQGRQVLILAPEVALAEKISSFAAKAFPDIETVDLSKKPSGNKLWRHYLKIKNNKAKIIIATRSGALMPFFDLGLIVVMDEGSSSHKQWEGHPLLDARDIADHLAEFFGAAMIRESGAPSVASFYRSQSGSYEFKSLIPADSAVVSPEVIDMRLEQRKGNFSALSECFTGRINEIIKQKKRAILYINRRGAANFIVCKNCGHIAKCPICQIPLVYYPEIKAPSGTAKYERLICNHCNFSHQPQNTCSKCKGTEIKYSGLGTQKIESQLRRDFPHINALRYDSDTIKSKKDSERILDSFTNKTPAIIIATQQIFGASLLPEISFIGVISLDAMLAIPDFRTNERVFSNIARLLALSRDLMIQSYNPENPAIKFLANMNYGLMAQKEIEDRRLLFYPPFSEIIKLSYQHSEPQNAKRETSLFAELLRSTLKDEITRKEVKILGPAPRFIFQEKGSYNWQLILKIRDRSADTEERNDIALGIKNKIAKIIPGNWEVDVSPENLL